MTDALGQGLKMFNQRLLAEHCLSETDARALWEGIRSNEYDMSGETFEESIAASNEQMKYAGLEIVGVSMPENIQSQQLSSTQDSGSRSKRGGKKLVRYYSIINRFPDDIAKNCFKKLFPPEQQAYVRLVFEKLVENGPTSRATVLNYKNILNDGNRNVSNSQRLSLSQRNNDDDDDDENNPNKAGKISLSLPVVEDIIEKLIDEKWLVFHVDGRNRRTSNSVLIDIGPRSYLELSYLLTDEFGMEKDDLPQQIYHRL